MKYKLVEYSVHEHDTNARRVLKRLERNLRKLLRETLSKEEVEQHFKVHLVKGREPAGAVHTSVSFFTSCDIDYPSRFFRVFDSFDSRVGMVDLIPLWAQSSRRIIAYNPDANTERQDKQSKKNCFDMALLDMHARLGGIRAPKKRRPHWSSGHKARRSLDDFMGTC